MDQPPIPRKAARHEQLRRDVACWLLLLGWIQAATGCTPSSDRLESITAPEKSSKSIERDPRLGESPTPTPNRLSQLDSDSRWLRPASFDQPFRPSEDQNVVFASVRTSSSEELLSQETFLAPQTQFSELPSPVFLPPARPSDPESNSLRLNPFPTTQPSLEVPLQGQLPATDSVHSNGQLITLSVRDAPLHSVLSLIAQQQGLSIVSGHGLTTPVSVTLQPMPLESALDALMAISGCTWNRVGNVIYVTEVKKETAENFLAQGRVLRVFQLNYLAAMDAEKVVTGLLSPVGKVFVRQTDSKDKRRTTEQLVIEDLPIYADRIGSYLAQADQPPQQVVVEVRMLQVKLQDNTRHGINFDALARLTGTDLNFSTQALATGTGQAALFTVDGNDFNSLLDCLATTNDTKTLASPKLLMINGQESKIQIGRRLGYFVTTTTQTSTLQDVQFLEVGVVLTVTPQISNDGQVVLKVRPKVSSGDINPTTTLPEEETTEVDTSIMVPDGHGVIIGGLIQEIDNERQSKVPILGDIWLIGRLFQRRAVERERSEVVVALLPRIVPLGNCPTLAEEVDLQRVVSPLLTPHLQSAPRPEPKLKDAINNPLLAPRSWRTPRE